MGRKRTVMSGICLGFLSVKSGANNICGATHGASMSFGSGGSPGDGTAVNVSGAHILDHGS